MDQGISCSPVTELVLSFLTPDSGTVNIKKGDSVKLVDAMCISNATSAEDAIIGQAMADAGEQNVLIPVKVRGVFVFNYTGTDAPIVNGSAGIVASATAGSVKKPATGTGRGINLAVNTTTKEVHVLI